MSYCKSFQPSVNEYSEILILGSMPGGKSLEMQQYYAYPRNRFWQVMSVICNFPDLTKVTYNEKLQILLDNKIALWDVISTCNREGSTDSKIKNPVLNDINGLVFEYINIKKICLNGGTAYNLFSKSFKNTKNIKICPLPSTSPMNTTVTTEELIKIWSDNIKF